jgi:hypothetical protein
MLVLLDSVSLFSLTQSVCFLRNWNDNQLVHNITGEMGGKKTKPESPEFLKTLYCDESVLSIIVGIGNTTYRFTIL